MLNWIYYCRVINILMALDNRWSFYFVFRHRKSPVLIRVTGHWSQVERSLCAAAARGHIGGEEEKVARRGGVLLGQRRVASIQRGAFRILFNERTDLKDLSVRGGRQELLWSVPPRMYRRGGEVFWSDPPFGNERQMWMKVKESDSKRGMISSLILLFALRKTDLLQPSFIL